MAGEFTTTIPVQSSNLKAVGYTRDMDALEIEFLSGSLYIYFDVPISLYHGLLAAPSKGKYFWKHIRPYKDQYPYEKLR